MSDYPFGATSAGIDQHIMDGRLEVWTHEVTCPECFETMGIHAEYEYGSTSYNHGDTVYCNDCGAEIDVL